MSAASALLLIDLQNDYFPGGAYPLPGAEAAAIQAEALLRHHREKGLPIVHIQHLSIHDGAFFFLPHTPGAAIRQSLAPAAGEPVIIKHRPNSFLNTNLATALEALAPERLVICGMMSNMCVDASVRAASDQGFACTVIHDACAASALRFQGVDVAAEQAHAAFMASLAFGYAELVGCAEYLSR